MPVLALLLVNALWAPNSNWYKVCSHQMKIADISHRGKEREWDGRKRNIIEKSKSRWKERRVVRD